MRIRTGEYTFSSFLEELIKTEIQPGKHLRVACFITAFNEWESPHDPFSLKQLLGQNGVEVRELGEIRRLVGRYYNTRLRKNVRVELFAYLQPETSLLLCFTTANKEDVDGTIGRIADTFTGFYYVFISSKTFGMLEDFLFNRFRFIKITYFNAYRSSRFSFPSEIRPNFDRSIEYYGDDGRKTLKEFKQFYGVLPKIIRFSVPDFAAYQVHNGGQFTLYGDGEEQRRFMLKIIDVAMKDILLTRRVIETSSFELIPIETERRVFRFPKLTPWIIRFSRPVEYLKGEDVISVISGGNFSVFNHVFAKGSLRLNGMVVDKTKPCIFTIDVNSERIVIAPFNEVSFDSFLRFYETIIEGFDPDAVCERFEQQEEV